MIAYAADSTVVKQVEAFKDYFQARLPEYELVRPTVYVEIFTVD